MRFLFPNFVHFAPEVEKIIFLSMDFKKQFEIYRENGEMKMDGTGIPKRPYIAEIFKKDGSVERVAQMEGK